MVHFSAEGSLSPVTCWCIYSGVDMVYLDIRDKEDKVWSLPVGSQFPLDLTFQPLVKDKG